MTKYGLIFCVLMSVTRAHSMSIEILEEHMALNQQEIDKLRQENQVMRRNDTARWDVLMREKEYLEEAIIDVKAHKIVKKMYIELCNTSVEKEVDVMCFINDSMKHFTPGQITRDRLHKKLGAEIYLYDSVEKLINDIRGYKQPISILVNDLRNDEDD